MAVSMRPLPATNPHHDLDVVCDAVDVALAELHLEAFLPADQASTEILRHRAKRWRRANRQRTGQGLDRLTLNRVLRKAA